MPQPIQEFVSADPASRGSASVAVTLPANARSVLGSPAGAIGAAIMLGVVVVAVLSPIFVTSDPLGITGPPLAAPSYAHPMGTDGLGRDLLSGVLHGAGTSLLIATSVGLLAIACGLSIGLVAGYCGGLADDVLMRMTELVQVLPRFFLVAVVVALFGPGIDRFVVAVGLTSWPVLARVVRSEVIAIRDLDFVLASEALGAGRAHILTRVLIPHVLPSVLVMAGLLLGQVLLMEASLGFLGLGDPSVITWGVLAGQAQTFLRVAWWLSVFPGLAIMLTVLGLNLLADAVSRSSRKR